MHTRVRFGFFILVEFLSSSIFLKNKIEKFQRSDSCVSIFPHTKILQTYTPTDYITSPTSRVNSATSLF